MFWHLVNGLLNTVWNSCLEILYMVHHLTKRLLHDSYTVSTMPHICCYNESHVVFIHTVQFNCCNRCVKHNVTQFCFVCEYVVQFNTGETYIRNKSNIKCCRKLTAQFPRVSVPSDSTIHQTVNKFWTMGLLLNKKHQETWRALIEETSDDTTAWLEVSTLNTFRKVITEDQCIKVICKCWHKAASLETIQIFTCAKTPRARPCCEDMIYNCFWQAMCSGIISRHLIPQMMHGFISMFT